MRKTPSFSFILCLSMVFSLPAVSQVIDPFPSTDSPTGLRSDYSVQLKGIASLRVDDSAKKVLDIIEGPITLEAWVKFEKLNQYNGIMDYGWTYKMGVNEGIFVHTMYERGDFKSGYTVTDIGKWIHMATVWVPGKGITYYKDGVQVGYVATTASSARLPQNNDLFIGSEREGVQPMTGWIDRVRIHKAALTPQELDADATQPKAVYSSTIVSFDFNEGQFPYSNNTTAALQAVPFNAQSSVLNWMLLQ